MCVWEIIHMRVFVFEYVCAYTHVDDIDWLLEVINLFYTGF